MKHRIGLFDERGNWVRDLTEPIEADTTLSAGRGGGTGRWPNLRSAKPRSRKPRKPL